ncbi:MAG: hypothetical protein CML13_18335 [Puniceicoccaceae bacterium]|nr:hypothetical protein [Puniceicoccaceae bacterium]|tara:strand:- start:8592 stop:8840 length:249 start_codon:yes stop_codon:yes gene_type:complete
MAELTNLTDRLAHLRDRNGTTGLASNEPEPKSPKAPKKAKQSPRKSLPERRFANDYFMFFVYALLAIAVLTQFAIIACLDLV